MAKTKQQPEDTNVVSLKTLTKSSVWDVQENDIFRMLESGVKDADIRENLRQRRLANTRRSPKDKRRDMSCIDHLPQDSTLAYQMLLPDIVVECARTKSFSQWL